MKLIHTVLFFLFLLNLHAQEPIVFSRLSNTSINQQDSIILVSTVGEHFDGFTEQNGVVVTTEPYPFLLFSNQSTGTKDLPLIEGLTIFPNPAASVVNLQRNDINQKLKVTLNRTDGTIMFEENWNESENIFSISLEKYASGVYILSITDEKVTKASQFKILKQ